MFAAIEDVRRLGPRKVVVAVPVAPIETVRRLRLVADEVVVLYSAQDFGSIGSFYADFAQVSDAAVMEALESAVSVCAGSHATAKVSPDHLR